MNIQLRYAVESDAPTLAEINLKAFKDQPFISNTFPHTPCDAIHSLTRARYLQKMVHPRTHVVVAVDADSGAVLGCARWVLHTTKAATPLSEAAAAEARAELALPEGANRDIYDGFFAILKERGEAYLREDDIVLEFIAILPEFQGRGIAKALLRWGTDQADQQQRRVYLEATTAGFPVYVKAGWAALERVEIDYARWGGEGMQALTLMARDPILPLTKPDIPEAVECIQTVFADDPFFRYMFDQSNYNIARNAASLSAHFLHGLSINAPIYIAKCTSLNKNDDNDTRIVGISWWHPPTPTTTTSSAPLTVRAQDWLLSLRQFLANVRYAGRGGLILPRYRQWKDLQDRTHGKIWTDPRGYYFCNVIAVRAEMRGRGVGRMLVEVVTERADEEKMPCYLESSKGMPNLAIYQKLGFSTAGEIECVDGKDICTLYCMIRQPAKIDVN
ncbi:acyl-CoA N-acyltransferase [Aspergillus varians]